MCRQLRVQCSAVQQLRGLWKERKEISTFKKKKKKKKKNLCLGHRCNATLRNGEPWAGYLVGSRPRSFHAVRVQRLQRSFRNNSRMYCSLVFTVLLSCFSLFLLVTTSTSTHILCCSPNTGHTFNSIRYDFKLLPTSRAFFLFSAPPHHRRPCQSFFFFLLDKGQNNSNNLNTTTHQVSTQQLETLCVEIAHTFLSACLAVGDEKSSCLQMTVSTLTSTASYCACGFSLFLTLVGLPLGYWAAAAAVGPGA